MARYEPRDIVDLEWGWAERRLVDLDDPDALLPRGAVLLCEEGHVAAIVQNSVAHGQVVEADDFAPLQEGMRLEEGKLIPCCRCGASLVRGNDDDGWSMNVQGKGWT